MRKKINHKVTCGDSGKAAEKMKYMLDTYKGWELSGVFAGKVHPCY